MKTRLFIVLCELSNVTALFCQKSSQVSYTINSLSTSISWSPAANLDGNGLTGRALLEPYSQDSKIYFDPVSTRLIFNLNIDRAKTPLTVSVYGQTGILLRRFSAGGAAFEADVSDFQPGVCYVLVTDAATNQPVAKQKILVR